MVNSLSFICCLYKKNKNFIHLYLQSSALGFLLAQKHFTNPLVAVPSAVSVVCMAVGLLLHWHSHEFSIQQYFLFRGLILTIFLSLSLLQLGGSALAVFWRNQPIPVDDKDDFNEWMFYPFFSFVNCLLRAAVSSWFSLVSQFALHQLEFAIPLSFELSFRELKKKKKKKKGEFWFQAVV